MFEDMKLQDMSDTEKMFIRHPATDEVIKDSKGNPMWILVKPKESVEGRKIERKILDARMKGKKIIDTAYMDDAAIEMLSALTVDWYLVKGDGTPADYECNDETKHRFYGDDSLRWIRAQVDAFVLDNLNFYKG